MTICLRVTHITCLFVPLHLKIPVVQLHAVTILKHKTMISGIIGIITRIVLSHLEVVSLVLVHGIIPANQTHIYALLITIVALILHHSLHHSLVDNQRGNQVVNQADNQADNLLDNHHHNLLDNHHPNHHYNQQNNHHHDLLHNHLQILPILHHNPLHNHLQAQQHSHLVSHHVSPHRTLLDNHHGNTNFIHDITLLLTKYLF
jgi:hypothetical protein